MNDDRRLVEMIDEHSKPKPMSRGQQVAFRIAVEERLERPSAMPWRAGLALAATAAMAAAIWLSSGPSPVNAPVEVVREEVPAAAPERVPQAPSDDALAPETEDETYLAFADPDEALELTDASEYLPDDYFVLAGLVDELEG